ncbi:MAG: hypothetical protein J6Q65_05250 [Lentisphaeria bacterium]|nr:hypothetical protein [Lentisphaeria bacterium]
MAEIIRYFSLTVEQFTRLTDQQMSILVYIRRFGSISPMEAFAELGITKLSTRISEMKMMGIQFAQNYESRTNRIGKTVRFMRYRRAAA